jgi:hypothetical protein
LSGRVVAAALLPLAVVIAAVAVFLRLHFQPPTVPAYTLTEVTGVPAAAGGGHDEVTLRPGSTFELVARPASPPAGIVGAKGFLLRSGDNRPWDAPYTAQADGTIRIGGPVDTVFRNIPAGAWDVAVAVGRPEMLPSMPADVERREGDTSPEPAAFHVVHQHVMLAAR